MNLFGKGAAVVNAAVRPFVASSVGDRLVGRWMTVLTYTGRRSGRTFNVPVGYSAHGDELTVRVEFPDLKNWWRNFLCEAARSSSGYAVWIGPATPWRTATAGAG